MIDKRLRILDQNVELDYWRFSGRAVCTPSRGGVGQGARDFAEDVNATPTRSPKASRFLDFVRGRNAAARAAGVGMGVGMGVRSYLDRL